LPYLPDLSELVPEMSLAWDGKADRQQYHLCLFGEKTGLRSILAPLADEFGADLLLPSGEPSATMMDRLVKRTIADGRPLVVLTFTDLDPTGQGIPASVADRLRAMLLLVGAGNIHVQVVPAALTVEQARAYDLPDAPLKKTEARAIRWQAATGRGQTEIDALATLQPEVLVQIARDAIKPFYDADLARRAREARETWEHQARQLLDAALDQMPAYRAAMQQLEQHHDDYAEAHAAMDAAISELRAAKDQAREQTKLPDLPELPECQATGVPVAAALYDSNDSFVANTMRLREAKLLDVAEKDEDGEDEEGDDDGGEACLSR
jgi:hypothetical protein